MSGMTMKSNYLQFMQVFFFIKYIFLLIPGDVMQYSATTMTGAMNASKQLENGKTTVNPPRNSKLFAENTPIRFFGGRG